MKISILNKCISSGLSKKPEENSADSIEIKEKPLDSGGQGKIYEVIQIDNKPVSDLLVKLFNDKEPLSNLETIINVVHDRKDEYRINQSKALRALPLFKFDGKMNNMVVYGHVMYKVGGVKLDDIFENDIGTYINLPLKDRVKLCYQFVEGMNILYNLTIVHADINSQNIMIDLKNMELAIIDLDGGAVAKEGSIPLVVGKIEAGWLDPEIYKQLKGLHRGSINVNISSDLWSIACGVHHLLFGLSPFFFIAGQPEIDDYLSRYKWPEFRGIKGIKIKNDSAFGYYERTFAQVSELHKLFKVSFNDGYSKPDRRISAAQWMIEIKEKLSLLDSGVPSLEINKTSFDYLNKPVNFSFSDSFVVSNTGSGTLGGKILAGTKSNINWLKVSQTSLINKPRQDIKFHIDASGLSSGSSDIGTIEIQSNGGTKSVSINLSIQNAIPKPKLEINKTSFDFPDKPVNSSFSGVFTITNAGSGSLSGKITAGTNSKIPWLKATQSSIAALPRQDIIINIDTSGLSPWFRDIGTIEIQSNGGNEKISVNLSVANMPPKLDVSISKFDFDNLKVNSAISKSFTIDNSGDGVLSGQILSRTRSGINWIKIPKNIIDAKVKQIVAFNIDTSSLNPGFKDAGTIEIQSNGGSKSIYINLSVEDRAPLLEIIKKPYDFYKKPLYSSFSDSFIITNAGGGTLSGKIITNKQWLKIPQSNFANKSRQEITFNIDTSGLSPGFRDIGTIEIQSNGGNESLFVNLSIEESINRVPVNPQVNKSYNYPYPGKGTSTKYYCCKCLRNTDTEIEYIPKIKVTCRECDDKREGLQTLVYRFSLHDKYTPCKCTEFEKLETFHVVYITHHNHVVCFCLTCGLEIRSEKPFKEIAGWEFCYQCGKNNAALKYIDENGKKHYLCSFCGYDKYDKS